MKRALTHLYLNMKLFSPEPEIEFQFSLENHHKDWKNQPITKRPLRHSYEDDVDIFLNPFSKNPQNGLRGCIYFRPNAIMLFSLI